MAGISRLELTCVITYNVLMDIDIDFRTNFNPQDVFDKVVPASTVTNKELKKHPCGYYFQTMPVDPVTDLAAIPYEEAEVLGFFKIDLLHLGALDAFESKQQMRDLIRQQPDWTLLLHARNVEKLFQIQKHAKLVSIVKPQSIQELADVVALIRPNKGHLLNEYAANKEKVRPFLYRQDNEDKSSFKRSHAIAYATMIVLQLHLIAQGQL